MYKGFCSVFFFLLEKSVNITYVSPEGIHKAWCAFEDYLKNCLQMKIFNKACEILKV